MTHVVTEACIQCKYTDCVEMCPVDCFREGRNFLAIDPEECIDCGLCVSECPVQAIKPQGALMPHERHFVALNQTLAAQWPVIRLKKSPLESAVQARHATGKLALLVKS